MAKTSPKNSRSQIPECELCFHTVPVERIECDLCGVRSTFGPMSTSLALGASTEAAILGKGWRLMRRATGFDGGAVQVCARCARKLGPNWEPVELAKEETSAHA
jgi:hypothetical protein